MDDKKLLEGKYLIYKDKPLVREDNVIVYGDMREKYYLFLMILSYKKDEAGRDIPDNVMIQVLGNDNKIIKQGYKVGLHDALDIGIIWLDRALAE